MTATITEIEQVVEDTTNWEESLVHAVCGWHGQEKLPVPICGTNDMSGWAPEDAKIDCPMCVDMITSNVICPYCKERMQAHHWEWAL